MRRLQRLRPFLLLPQTCISSLIHITPMFLLLITFNFCILFLQTFTLQDIDPCEKDEDPGPCQQFQVRWYWDKLEKKCKEFHYGGCLGNGNRFESKNACIKQCLYKLNNPNSIPELCFLPPDKGECENYRNGERFYYFDAALGKCEPFLYRGCGGNDNRFYSLQRCRTVCAERVSPHTIECSKCDLRVSYCKQYSKYNYSCECNKGYQKGVNNECLDINECILPDKVCDVNAECYNTPGSYTCRCKSGYRGNGRRCSFVGIGRATLDYKKCSKHATWSHGVCTCKEGFRGNGLNCSDVNECLQSVSACHKYAECRNVQGSYTCECNPGYAGNGYFCTKENEACLDPFDHGYMNQCGVEQWREHYFFDHETKKCKQFWYDGCPGSSRNIFSKLHACELLCEFGHALDRAEICWDKFDPKFTEQCGNGKKWEQKFYFDHHSMTCKMFWYDGCALSTNNVFNDLLQCQWLCEEPAPYKSKTCLEVFEEQYRNDCGGPWVKRYYYDKYQKKCEAFWYSGCKGVSQNIYKDEQTCMEICANPAKTQVAALSFHPKKYKEATTLASVKDRAPRRTVAPTKLIEVTEKIRRKIFNLCEYDNPCANNGKCQFDLNKNRSYCECAKGFKGENCTEKTEFDPCASKPCLNGATCLPNPNNMATFQCFCTSGFGGETCDKRPCDPAPCFNNASCAPTTAYPWFLCRCTKEYSGQYCEDEKVINSTRAPKYGPQVKQFSSVDDEWIEKLRKSEEAKRKRERERLLETTTMLDETVETNKIRREEKAKQPSIVRQQQQPRKSSRKAWKSRDVTVSAAQPSSAAASQPKNAAAVTAANTIVLFVALVTDILISTK